jgi:hypothetical protein
VENLVWREQRIILLPTPAAAFCPTGGYEGFFEMKKIPINC